MGTVHYINKSVKKIVVTENTSRSNLNFFLYMTDAEILRILKNRVKITIPCVFYKTKLLFNSIINRNNYFLKRRFIKHPLYFGD